MLGALTGLTALDLSGFLFGQDRAVPHHLSNLSGLRRLRLGNATDSMGNAYNVEGWSREAVAASLTCLCPLTAALTHLNLRQFGLERVPAAVGELTGLEELILDGNRLGIASGGGGGGWVGAPISRLTRLSRLDLTFCKVWCVPQELAALPRLQWLKLTVSGERLLSCCKLKGRRPGPPMPPCCGSAGPLRLMRTFHSSLQTLPILLCRRHACPGAVGCNRMHQH